MIGQMKSYKEHEIEMDCLISEHNPYKKSEPLNFDLRGWASFLKKNNIVPGQEPANIQELAESFFTK